LHRSSSSSVCPAPFHSRPADEHIPHITRTNLAGCSLRGIWSRCCLRGLRPFVQPCQNTRYPNPPGLRTAQTIERRLQLPGITALVICCGHDFVLETRRDHCHNKFQNYPPHYSCRASPWFYCCCCLSAVVNSSGLTDRTRFEVPSSSPLGK